MKKFLSFIIFCIMSIDTYASYEVIVPIYVRIQAYPQSGGVVFGQLPRFHYYFWNEEYQNYYTDGYTTDLSYDINNYSPSYDLIGLASWGWQSYDFGFFYVHAHPNDDYHFINYCNAEYKGPMGGYGVFPEPTADDFVFSDSIHGRTFYFEDYGPDWNGAFPMVNNLVMIAISENRFGWGWQYEGDAGRKGDPWFVVDLPTVPKEFCWALFARVKINETEDGEITIVNHTDELSNIANDVGDIITITAKAKNEEDSFLYWIEESTGRHITENPYTFTVSHKDSYTPVFGNPAGIETPENTPDKNNPTSIYTIDGKQLQKEPTEGIYIKNGKKVLVK